MGSQEANDARRSCSPRVAPAQQLFLDIHHHVFDILFVTDEAQSRAVEGKRFESTANDSKVSAISTDYTINDSAAD